MAIFSIDNSISNVSVCKLSIREKTCGIDSPENGGMDLRCVDGFCLDDAFITYETSDLLEPGEDCYCIDETKTEFTFNDRCLDHSQCEGVN